MAKKTIIVKDENRKTIEELFDALQKRCSARTVDYRDINRCCHHAEDRIGNITKKALEGTRIMYHGSERFPSSYKYTPESTHFELLFKSGKWVLLTDSIRRDDCPKNKTYPYDLYLSETAKEAVLKSLT